MRHASYKYLNQQPMAKQLPIKEQTKNERQLVRIEVDIAPFTRTVSAVFVFAENAEFSDGSKESKRSGRVVATEAELGPVLTDENWAAISALAHGLADAQGV
jgi:hypothetical protein